jgi:hypothetical protein
MLHTLCPDHGGSHAPASTTLSPPDRFRFEAHIGGIWRSRAANVGQRFLPQSGEHGSSGNTGEQKSALRRLTSVKEIRGEVRVLQRDSLTIDMITQFPAIWLCLAWHLFMSSGCKFVLHCYSERVR